MNSIVSFGGETLIVFLSVLLSFLGGAVLRISRTLARERREVDRARLEMREVSERCDLQQMNMMRLGQAVEELRRGAATAAPAPAPVAAAVRAVAPATPRPAPRPVAAKPAARVGATPARAPAPRPAATPARTPSAFELARGGAGLDAIMKVCRLSRAEAELVLSVHGRGAAA